MIQTGILLALLSGICNGLFTSPMKLESRWKWENIWFVFILTSCVVMPLLTVEFALPDYGLILSKAPIRSVISACIFGFAWGFGAICFGRSVDSLGVSVANSIVLGISSALGSLIPLLLLQSSPSRSGLVFLFAGIFAFVIGVVLCGVAGRLRDHSTANPSSRPALGFLFAGIAGVMSAIFNIGYTLAQPIADTGVSLHHSRDASTNCIWLLMLGAGAIPNVVYCLALMSRNHTGHLLFGSDVRPDAASSTGSRKRSRLASSWLRSIAMGLLWGGSILLYGAATPKLGTFGPSVGWPLSLATGLLVANLAGVWLGEWRGTVPVARRRMYQGISILLAAIALCGFASKLSS